MIDATRTIRASVRDVEITLLISIALVILVVFVFLRSVRSTLIPSVAVPISLIGTFGVMYLLGYTIDNLSLMALTVATGFVVDDAIVVVENITRHLEEGMKPMEAALHGAKEIGFTVVSISISLVAVFIPILLMGGHRRPALPGVRGDALGGHRHLHGRVAHDHAHDVRAAPAPARGGEKHGRLFRASERAFTRILGGYERSLAWVLRHQRLTIAVTLGTMAATVYLYSIDPQGLLPAAGHRADERLDLGGPGHLLPVDAGQADRVREDAHGGSRRRERRRLPRRGDRTRGGSSRR